MRSIALLVVALLPVFPAKAQENSADVNQFAELEKRIHGRIGVYAVDASRNKQVAYRAQERFAMCSTFKLLAVAAVLKRVDDEQEKLDRFVRYGEKQLLTYAPVTRAHVKEGGMTLEALCAAAIEQSDNTAANLLLNAIGGPKGVTGFARAIGDKETRLDRMEPALNVVVPGDKRDTTTPAAMAKDLQRLHTSDLLSARSQARLEGWLQANQTGLKMIRASVPEDWKTGDKTGRSGTGAVNDIAVIRPPTGGPLFLAIYTENPNDTEEARDALVATVAKIAIEALSK
jgi:beta-lactamase class A